MRSQKEQTEFFRIGKSYAITEKKIPDFFFICFTEKQWESFSKGFHSIR
jgi:hypothetical protein